MVLRLCKGLVLLCGAELVQWRIIVYQEALDPDNAAFAILFYRTKPWVGQMTR